MLEHNCSVTFFESNLRQADALRERIEESGLLADMDVIEISMRHHLDACGETKTVNFRLIVHCHNPDRLRDLMRKFENGEI